MMAAKLTPTQVAIAKRLNIPLEEYAREILKLGDEEWEFDELYAGWLDEGWDELPRYFSERYVFTDSRGIYQAGFGFTDSPSFETWAQVIKS